MDNFFDECKTVESLNRKRQDLMSKLNLQYTAKKKELLSQVPPFRRIPIVTMESVKEVESIIYSAFPLSEVKAGANEVIFDATGKVSY